VGLPEQRLAHDAHRKAARRRLDGRAKAGAPRADDEHVVVYRLMI
jgi:hypothetical protein